MRNIYSVVSIINNQWGIYVYYDTTPYDTEELLGKLRSLGCSENGVLRTRKQLLRGGYNNGFTYSNRALKQSVVSLGRASKFSQFLNSFSHELHHLSTHIAQAYGIPLDGEDVCYLSGSIAQKMYPILIHYLTRCRL